jgi:hypothetical protein
MGCYHGGAVGHQIDPFSDFGLRIFKGPPDRRLDRKPASIDNLGVLSHD